MVVKSFFDVCIHEIQASVDQQLQGMFVPVRPNHKLYVIHLSCYG